MAPPPKFRATNNLFGSQTQTLSREKEETEDNVLENIAEKIYEIPDLLKPELGDGLANVLGAETEDISKDKFVNSKKFEDDALENIKEGYGVDEIKDAFDEAAIQNNLNFPMVMLKNILFVHVTFCRLTMTIENLLLFLYQILGKI